MDYVLCHYGLKGMKWGVRRWQNADGTFNEAGKQRYFGSDGSSSGRAKGSSGKSSNGSKAEGSTQKKGLTDKQKKALKVGAAVVGTALVAYGAYKLNDKATKALVESYMNVGSHYADRSMTLMMQSRGSRSIASGLANQGSMKSANDFLDISSKYENESWLNGSRASALKDKAYKKNFSVRERANAAGKILTKGTDSFKREKERQLISATEDSIAKFKRSRRSSFN